MKILLTGATGFLGTHLLEVFLKLNYTVLITKRRSTDLRRLLKRFGTLETWDIDELELIFSIHPDINVIVHAATDYGRDSSNPTSTFWANEEFPMRLIELAIKKKIARFINMDTFFNSDKVSYEYLGAYILSKRHFQEWGRHYANAGLIAFVNLRLFHLYGAGDDEEKFVPNLVRRCLAGEDIDLTDGKQKRDFIHVDDVVAAVCAVLEVAIERDNGYSHYDVGTGASLSIREFVQNVKRLCGSSTKLNFGALSTRNGEFHNAYAETKALRSIGWIPRVDIETGILTVIEDIGLRQKKL